MKRICVRLIAGVITLCMVMAAFATILPVTAFAAGLDVDAYGAGTRGFMCVSGSGASQRVKVNAPFTGFSFDMYAVAHTDNTGTLSVYQWAGDYETTIAGEPLVSKYFAVLNNGDDNWIEFDALPAGEYLFHYKGDVYGLWCYDSNAVSQGYAYNNGKEMAKDLCLTVRFANAVDAPFSPCTSVGEREEKPEAVIPEDSLHHTTPVQPDTWVFTDGLGRVSLTNKDVGDVREDKTVAMFYWTWHSGFSWTEPFNVNEAYEKYPEAKNDWESSIWRVDVPCANFWNESIYGYYNGMDPWVYRRQAELFANAGVDAIFTDNTNETATWKAGYDALYAAWDEALDDGVNTPKVSFMLPFLGGGREVIQLRELYTDIYEQGRYEDLWFTWEGKPMIMSDYSNLNHEDELEGTIAEFFTFRQPYAGYHMQPGRQPGGWGWLSCYPQVPFYDTEEDAIAGNVEQMTVSIAQNFDYRFGSLAAMNGRFICGRSYTSTYPDRYTVEGKEASKWGYNFAEQWEYALEYDPEVVFVTGWNEYIMGRYENWSGDVDNAFPDQFNDEFSRDIEPSKGDLKDHYYYQLVNYVRQYKGATAIPTPGVATTIDMNAGEEQWKTVEPYYAAYKGNTFDRDSEGYGSTYYLETSGRNDIIGAQVARDDNYVYFHVECADNITPYTDALWMNLYIDSDQNNQGWNTFEYVLNKSAASEKTLVLERFTATDDYSKTEKVADVEYTVDGRYMTVKIAKSDLGLSGDEFTVNFAWTDNVHDEGDYTTFSGDIMDFYISGDVAPGGRFKYSYDLSVEDDTPTTPETSEPSTDAPTTDAPVTDAPVTDAPATDAPATSAPATDATTAAQGGCGSLIAVPVALATLLGAGYVLHKRRED